MRRYRFGIGAVLALGVCGVLATLGNRAYFAPERSYQRLQLGMTLAEVSAALGARPGDYATPLHPVFDRRIHGRIVSAQGQRNADGQLERWLWNDWWIFATFDEEGRLTWTALLQSNSPDEPGLFERLRRRLGL